MIHACISLALRKPSVLVRMTWEKTRGLLEFQLLPTTPLHYAASMAVKRRNTAPECVAYQLANCAAIRFQQRYQIALYTTTLSRCNPLL